MKIKVSIIEDLEEVRRGIVFLIKSSDEFECIADYANAEDALDDIESNLPDVLIMDLGLPGISGIECTRRIKAKHPEVQIMISTVYQDDARLFNALSAGASSYILKRTSTITLLEAIKDLHNGGSPMSPQIGRRVVDSLHGIQTDSNRNKINKQPISVLRSPGKKIADSNLSKREIEILELLSAGYRNKDIAEKLFISTHTVRSHIYHIYEKLHVQSRVEAVNKLVAGD